jgi:hypothetical protein
MILGLVMYLLVEDTGNIHAQCLDIMPMTFQHYSTMILGLVFSYVLASRRYW